MFNNKNVQFEFAFIFFNFFYFYLTRSSGGGDYCCGSLDLGQRPPKWTQSLCHMVLPVFSKDLRQIKSGEHFNNDLCVWFPSERVTDVGHTILSEWERLICQRRIEWGSKNCTLTSSRDDLKACGTKESLSMASMSFILRTWSSREVPSRKKNPKSRGGGVWRKSTCTGVTGPSPCSKRWRQIPFGARPLDYIWSVCITLPDV